jgi:large subunit ribosomal protein L13
MKKQKTEYANKSKVEKKWLSINAAGKTVGRLASEVAKQLMGKNNVLYTPSVVTGEFVILYNAEKVIVTGNKADQKVYFRHSRFPGGLKETSYKEMLQNYPERILMYAIKGMLPKNKLGKKMLTRLRVFKGENHNLEAQTPLEHEFSSLKESK